MWSDELFSPIDEMTAEAIGNGDENLSLLVKYLSAAFRNGYLFVRFSEEEVDPNPGTLCEMTEDDLKNLCALLRQGFCSFNNAISSQIIKDGNCLFLRRAWELSRDIDIHFDRLQKAQSKFPVDEAKVKAIIEEYLTERVLFPEQAEAVLQAVKHPLFCIWGGPGTGKTHTAGMFLKVLLQSLQGIEGAKFRMAIAAPTGKATNNLAKSIKRAFGTQEIEIEVKTLHSILKIRQPGQRREEDSEEVLPYDLLLVDESSMIDSSLCAKLLSRLASGSRLLFLGDPAQLPPVEPGDPFRGFVEAQGVSIGKLDTSRRTELQPILDLAALVREGKEQETIAFLKSPQDGISFHCLEEASFLTSHAKELLSGFSGHMSEGQQFQQLFKRQMLSPLKAGPFGTERINAQIHKEVLLRAKGSYFEPIVITKNDYQLSLSNGQIGLGFEDRVIFESTDAIRAIPRVLLSSYEHAYCLSVHKSQGSEFDTVVLLLPPGSESFGRKMLYTAITRARKRLEIWSSEETVRSIVRRS